MFCPKCKTEYREGFTHCADCDFPLVDALPADTDRSVDDMPDYVNLKTVFRTTDQGQIALAKSMLDSHNIAYTTLGEHTLMGGGAIYVRFMVPENKVKLAAKILKDFS